MKRLRGGTHSTLTETAAHVVNVLFGIPGVKKISPGIINQNSKQSGLRTVNIVITNAGFELGITGQGTQKVAVHCSPIDTSMIVATLRSHKKLSEFTFRVRERKPGI
jgi:hypothetical protein